MAGAAALAAPMALIAAARLLFGLSSACLMPAVSATASLWVPLARKASSISFIYACFNIGEWPAVLQSSRTCRCTAWPQAAVHTTHGDIPFMPLS
jgi:hypothetical protein